MGSTVRPSNREIEMSKQVKITIGDSSSGYDTATADVVNGHLPIVAKSVNGRITYLRRAVAALNRGASSYVTPGGDEKPIRVSAA